MKLPQLWLRAFARQSRRSLSLELDMNEFDGISPIQNSAMEGKPISIRLYNFIIAALIFIGFCVMGAGCYITRDIHFLMYLSSHAFSVMGITFLGTIGGLILMSVAQSRQSVPCRSVASFSSLRRLDLFPRLGSWQPICPRSTPLSRQQRPLPSFSEHSAFSSHASSQRSRVFFVELFWL